MNNKYSEKEIQLITYFGYQDLIMHKDLTAPTIYQMMINKAFMLNINDAAAESLRRCYTALTSGKIYRLTPQWDEMIRF